MTIEQQIQDVYGFADPECEYLDTPVNGVVKVTAEGRQYALKLYHQNRTHREVQWEADLVVYLMQHGAPVSKPTDGKKGHVESFTINGQERAAILFEWAPGEKPTAQHDTYVLLGSAAARIHQAIDSFNPSWMREDYNTAVLIDEQLKRMKDLLVQAGQWQQLSGLCERLKGCISNPNLDKGICHMDLTLDNVHREGGALTVFDFDSAGKSWRAIEPYGVLKFSKDYFNDWLEGYRAVRNFSKEDEKAVAVFGIVGDLRVVAWKLGVARSSRGKPLLASTDLPAIVSDWLNWEAENIG